MLDVIENNYDDYVKELQNQKDEDKRFSNKVRGTLNPADREKFDDDPEFAR